MRYTITIRPTIPKARLQKFARGNLNRWVNGLIEGAVVGQERHKSPASAPAPNKLTERTLNASKTGRGVKQFGSKKALYADLGL